MKIKIISEGNSHNTKVINMDTEEELEGVTSIEWGIYGPDQISECTLILHNIPLEVVENEIVSHKMSTQK